MMAGFPHSKGDLAVEAWRCGLGENGLGLLVRLNANDGSNGCDIGNRRWSCVNSMPIRAGIVWTFTGAPEILLLTVKPVRLWAVPPIGISMGAVIVRVRLKRWIGVGLGAQGA
jgi:hypothetical protein